MGNMFRLLTAREIECRVQSVKASGLVLLLYKDARCDQNILDETVGPMNWKRAHTRDNANCIVSIYDSEKKEWISKEDTGTESNTEAAKGLASDSFKRACVNWGIGRELYTAPFIWIPADLCYISGGKCYDRFDVTSIGYTENREINSLVIKNENTGKIVFDMNHGLESQKKAPPKEPAKAPKPAAKPVEKPKLDAPEVKCADCGKFILTVFDGGSVKATAHDIIMGTMKKYGRSLCWECAFKANADKAS